MDSSFDDYVSVRNAVSSGFGGERVLVVGDLMLDRYLWGEVNRISPEAPVPVLRLKRRTEAAGGAANVAANLARLGLRVSVSRVAGADPSCDALMKLLQAEGIHTGAVASDPARPTITKTRIIGGHQQMMRLDEEEVAAHSRAIEDEMVERAMAELATVSALILSDYAKGTLGTRCCRALISQARKLGLLILVDPKGADYSKYAGATALTPNTKELSAATGFSTRDAGELLSAGLAMRTRIGVDLIIVTQGEQGITICDAGGCRSFPAVSRDVFDVSGAGDTVIATVTAGMLAGLGWDDSMRLANVAAGIVVAKVGTSPLQQQELLDAVHAKRHAEQASKIVDLAILRTRLMDWRGRGERIVFTNGCFDIMHAGHVTYLERARSEGHRLIVGLNSDRSVHALKGHTRPIIPETDRARVLASLESVDAVVMFDEETPLDLILAIRPDVLVKGSDYEESEIVGASELKDWMGKLVLVPKVEGLSTSHIVNKIRAFA